MAHDDKCTTRLISHLDLFVEPGTLFAVNVAAASTIEEDELDTVDVKGVPMDNTHPGTIL